MVTNRARYVITPTTVAEAIHKRFVLQVDVTEVLFGAMVVDGPLFFHNSPLRGEPSGR